MSAKRQPPRLIPVLDVMNGQVVRAVGGRRDEYRPVVSKLTASTEPVEVARALLAATGASELYVADLDAIQFGNGMSLAVREFLERIEVAVWVDAGLNGSEPLSEMRVHPGIQHVIALETCSGLVSSGAVTRSHNTTAFSIDLKGGELMGRWREWTNDSRDALSVARAAVSKGFHTIIVLDLARVGTGTGTGTEPLLREIRAAFPHVDLIAGGGVRTWDDVDRLGEAGATGVLVASALHDGTLKVLRSA